MPIVKIDDYILDFKPGSTGIVYFKTQDGAKRKTPELQSQVFNSVCAVLERPSVFDTDGYTFRNIPSNNSIIHSDEKQVFTIDDFKNTENFETWQLL